MTMHRALRMAAVMLLMACAVARADERLFAEAFEHFQAQRYDRAIALFREGLKRAPNDGLAHFYAAQAYMAIAHRYADGSPENAAVNHFNEAVRLLPPSDERSDALILIGRLQTERRPAGRSDQATPSALRDCSVCPELVLVKRGTFTMGSGGTWGSPENGSTIHEGPPHTVTIERDFAVGKYEVTFDEWGACVSEGGCSHKPSDAGWGRARRPVIDVSWHDAKEYAAWLSRKTRRTYRLLTEAEWEYVARAGTTSPYSVGGWIAPKLANYLESPSYAGSPVGAGGRTIPVGSYPPNRFGVHDVHGNVWEWVEDRWNENYRSSPVDGSAWTSGDYARNVLRGGSWNSYEAMLRSAYRRGMNRQDRSNDVGFRIARD